MGLANGDTVTAVEGLVIVDPETASIAERRLCDRNTPQVRLRILRRGRALELPTAR